MYHVVIQILCNALATLVFAAFLLLVEQEASATRSPATLVTHCPGCDTTEPSYGSSSFENRYEAGKYQPGDGRTPYERSSNERRESQRYERERQEQQKQQEQQRQQYRPYGSSHYGSSNGYDY